MQATTPPPQREFPPVRVELDQLDRYRFAVRFPDSALASYAVDEGPPIGSGSGPDPVQSLAAAVGHCLSSTLYNTLERSHVRASPMKTRVNVTVGRNARGRKRVLALDVAIDCAPLDEADRARFERSTQIFDDYCTVTGAVREGIRVQVQVAGGMTPTP